MVSKALECGVHVMCVCGYVMVGSILLHYVKCCINSVSPAYLKQGGPTLFDSGIISKKWNSNLITNFFSPLLFFLN